MNRMMHKSSTHCSYGTFQGFDKPTYSYDTCTCYMVQWVGMILQHTQALIHVPELYSYPETALQFLCEGIKSGNLTEGSRESRVVAKYK